MERTPFAIDDAKDDEDESDDEAMNGLAANEGSVSAEDEDDEDAQNGMFDLEAEVSGEDDDEEGGGAAAASGLTDYDYLLGMAIWSLTKEKVCVLLLSVLAFADRSTPSDREAQATGEGEGARAASRE